MGRLSIFGNPGAISPGVFESSADMTSEKLVEANADVGGMTWDDVG